MELIKNTIIMNFENDKIDNKFEILFNENILEIIEEVTFIDIVLANLENRETIKTVNKEDDYMILEIIKNTDSDGKKKNIVEFAERR